jgi:hypothetical protein
MSDLIMRGGDIVTPQGVMRGDVAFAGETIATVLAPGTLDGVEALIGAIEEDVRDASRDRPERAGDRFEANCPIEASRKSP